MLKTKAKEFLTGKKVKCKNCPLGHPAWIVSLWKKQKSECMNPQSLQKLKTDFKIELFKLMPEQSKWLILNTEYFEVLIRKAFSQGI